MLAETYSVFEWVLNMLIPSTANTVEINVEKDDHGNVYPMDETHYPIRLNHSAFTWT